MKVIACVLLLVAAAMALPQQDAFERFKARYGKTYETEEEHSLRRAIFNKNVARINEHNRQDKGFTLRMNEFGDMDSAEFGAIYNGYQQEQRDTQNIEELADVELPAHVDWRKKGYVTAIKNQGQCGSCWAFSATGSLEGQHFKGYHHLVSLSEQNLVDCSDAEGNMGCNGGLMDQAFTYIKLNHGIDTEKSYPYTAVQGPCKYNAAHRGANDTGFHNVISMSEKDLTLKVATIGPISVAIDASHFSFQFYSSGIYYEPECSTTILDHGVLAVGYGATTAHVNNKYYIVKNSWGTDWGMKGYIFMSKDRNNNCGIATEASYPTGF